MEGGVGGLDCGEVCTVCGGEGRMGGVGEFEMALSGRDRGVGGGEFVVVGEGGGEVWEGVGLGKGAREGWGSE